MVHENYSMVRLLTDRYKDQGVTTGTVGCIIEVYGEDAYEVEFSDKDGITIALLSLTADEIEPVTEDKH